MASLYLIISLIFSTIGNISVKLSEGFTRKLPSIGVFVFFTLCIYYLTLSIQYLEISIVYAIWSGVSVAATTLMGILIFRESANARKIISILLIIIGVVSLELYG
ncbi:DMT family transporter [Halobacillus sp. MO56]